MTVQARTLEALPLRQLATAWSEDAPATTYERIRPVVFDADMRDLMAGLSCDFAPVVTRPVESATLTDATVLGDGQIIVGNRYVVEETMANLWHTNERGSLLRIEGSRFHVTSLDLDAIGTEPAQAVVVKQTLDRNYGHWLIDTLPRVRWAKRRLGGRAAAYLVNAEASRSVVLDSLAAFGVEAGQVVFSGPEPRRFERVVYVAPMAKHAWIKHPLLLTSLREAFGVEETTGGGKLYVSRNKYHRRRLLNEDELLELLLPRGYRPIHPEQMTLAEQVAAFARADVVIGNLGAALSNLVFSPRGVKVFALATQTMRHDYFYDIVCHRGGEYWAMQGNAVDDDPTMYSDFTIDAKAFEAALARFD